MAITLNLLAHHPDYDEHAPDWEIVADCYAGQRAVKDRGDVYLPKTSSMLVPTEEARLAYEAYKTRAVFHSFVRQAITGLVGVVHRKPPVVKVPEVLGKMVASMTLAGESLEILWQRITEMQLLTGRGGLLVDVPDGVSVAESVPYVALYGAASILNWNAGELRDGRAALSLVVLDESAAEQQADLTWQSVTEIRVLALGSTATMIGTPEAEARPPANDYQVAIARQGDVDGLVLGAFRTPAIGSVSLDRIPFVFFGTNDMTPTPGAPPLLDLANLDLAVYRAEADYRQSLFMQGQDTLVRVGATDPNQPPLTGAAGLIDLNIGGSAMYIGVSSSGLGEQRQALENDKDQASTHVVQLLDGGGGKSAESGEALRVRVSARTAKLSTMQLTAAAVLREALIHAGRWLSLSEAVLEAIEVTPNLDYTDDAADATTVNVLVDAKIKGAPISWRQIHRWLQLHEFTELDFDAEQEEIAAELTDGGVGAPGVDIDPTAGAVPGMAA